MLKATFNEPLNWRKMFSEGGDERARKRPTERSAIKVVLTPAEGKSETSFYSKKTGLPLKTVATLESSMGEIEAESTAAEYKDFGGVLMPAKINQKVGPGEVIMTISNVKVNESIPPGKFAIPRIPKRIMEQALRRSRVEKIDTLR